MDPLKAIVLLPGFDPYRNSGGYVFDADKAVASVRFFHEELKHVKGHKRGTPFYLEDWQQGLVMNLFGWVDAYGYRRFRRCLLFIPRKNGKTPLAAGLILYLLFEDGEPGAEIYGAASEYKQASLVFSHVRGMIAQNSDLMGRCQVFKGQSKAVELKEDLSIYRVVAADALSAHGWNTHAGVVDELHAQKDGELVDALETSTAARKQPLLFYLTTSDYARESVCNAMYDEASKVRDGVIQDPAFLPVIYEASQDDDWSKEATWLKANPNWAVSVEPDYIRKACQRAQDIPRFENEFKRLHLNIRTEQDVRFLSMTDWDACSDPCEPDALMHRPCFAGLDLASKTDITSLVLVFPPTDDDEMWRCLPHFFVPAAKAIPSDAKNRFSYEQWVREGVLIATPGNVTDYRIVRKTVNELAETYQIQEIAFDPWNASHIANLLGEEDGFAMVEFRQGFGSMSEPTKELEALVLSQRLAHGAHPVLRWMASNVNVKTDPAGNLKPVKPSAGSAEKIDGIVALVMGIGRALGGSEGPSVYEDRGLLVL